MDQLLERAAAGDLAVLRRARSYAANLRSRARSQLRRSGVAPGLLSIIVPVYNVEKYLDECLMSLRSQSQQHVEIVVVDDGSPDNSLAIARRHRLRDPRIRIVRRPNGGLSAARNTGVAAARGEFIAFADSDDTVTADGYAAAVTSLTESGSDFAVLPYQRLRGGVISPAASWIREVHAQDRIGLAVDDYPEIQVNAIACSKVFRRDFWEQTGLHFVEGIIYEDQQVSAEAYARARAFDVLSEPLYNWRARTDRTSISQNKREAENLRAQLAAANESIKVLRAYASQRVVQERVVQLISNDLAWFTGLVHGCSDDFWQVLEDELPELIDQLPSGLYVERIPAQHKVLNHLIATGQRKAAESFVEAGGLALRSFPVGEEEVGRVVYLPLWQVADADIPRRFFLLSAGQTRARCSVRAVRSPEAGLLDVDAWAFIQNVDLATNEQVVRATARAHAHEPVSLPVTQYADDAIDEFPGVSGSGFCDYRAGGVRVRVDLTALAPGTWTVDLDITAGSLSRTIALSRPWPGAGAALRQPAWAGTGRAVAIAPHGGRLRIRVFEEGHAALVVETLRVHDGTAALTGPGLPPDSITLARRNGQQARGTVTSADGGWTATFRLPAAAPSAPGEPVQWHVEARRDGADLPVRLAPVEREPGGLDWRPVLDKDDRLVLRVWPIGAQVTRAAVHQDHVEVGMEVFGLDLADYRVLFESAPHTSAAVVDTAGSSLTCRLPHREQRWGRPDQVLMSATYWPVLEHRRTGHRISPRVAPALLAQLPQDVLTPQLRVLLHLRAHDQGALAVVVAPPLTPEERGGRNQLQLELRANAGSGSERSVVFRTLYGEAANDNALAIHEELRRRGTDLTLYWSVRDHSVPLPEGAVPLIEDSREWHERLGDAGYVVVNVHQPMWYVKPDKQVMVETFHGYPYKGMGQTWWDRSGLPGARVAAFLERAAAWDYLVSPAGYATPHLLREFFTPEAAHTVKVLEVGYPRNDILLRPEGHQVRERVRRALGIRDDQKAVLYAPTFRDYLSNDGMTARSADFFDAHQAARLLGEGYVVLQRGHAFHARGNQTRLEGDRVVDVTYYPDIAELSLASDAAILDYSSLRFDYALTGKPMVFLVPDKDLYHQLRPAIIDYEPTAPGPHVDTTAAAAAELRDLDGLRRRYRRERERFVATYMEQEDGHAAERVVDAVFRPSDPAGRVEEVS
jgi:CDP-glycerol glycerophosphotransferase